MSVVDRVARGAFGRVNTSIAITMASRVSVFLSGFMSRSELVLLSVVVMSLLVCARRSGAVRGVYKNPLTTAKSVMGIVATTAIMKQVDDMGSSLSPGGPTTASQDLLPGQGIAVSRIPSVVLGTCFVLASGAIPGGLRGTEEGAAIYMGMQYAYSDIILSSVTGQDIRRALSMVFVLMLPTLHGSLARVLEGSGPLSTLLSSATFAGEACLGS